MGQRDRSWTSLVGGKDLLRVVAAATAIIRGVLPADALAGFRPVEMRKGECFARKRKGAGPCPWAMGLIVTLKSAWRHGRRTFLTVTSQRWRPWACVPACKTTRSCPRACANVQLAAHTVRRGVTKLAYAFGGAPPPHTHTHTIITFSGIYNDNDIKNNVFCSNYVARQLESHVHVLHSVVQSSVIVDAFSKYRH